MWKRSLRDDPVAILFTKGGAFGYAVLFSIIPAWGFVDKYGLSWTGVIFSCLLVALVAGQWLLVIWVVYPRGNLFEANRKPSAKSDAKSRLDSDRVGDNHRRYDHCCSCCRCLCHNRRRAG